MLPPQPVPPLGAHPLQEHPPHPPESVPQGQTDNRSRPIKEQSVSVRSVLTRGSVFVAAGLATVLTLSACGSSDPLASSSTSAATSAAASGSASAAAGGPIIIGSA